MNHPHPRRKYNPPPGPLPPPLSPQANLFELGMSLVFPDGAGCSKTVIYEGVMPDGLTHTVWRQDGTRLNIHVAHLCLKLQADLTNIPCTPLNYCKEVGKGITKEEAEALPPPPDFNPSPAGADGLASLPIPSLFSKDILIGRERLSSKETYEI
jgi:hypothetical protein